MNPRKPGNYVSLTAGVPPELVPLIRKRVKHAFEGNRCASFQYLIVKDLEKADKSCRAPDGLI